MRTIANLFGEENTLKQNIFGNIKLHVFMEWYDPLIALIITVTYYIQFLKQIYRQQLTDPM